MILWINGTYGVGKTSVANRIAERMNSYHPVVLNSDFYYLKLGQNSPHLSMSGGTTPQNNINFLLYFKTIINNCNEGQLVIIDMAATMKESKEILIEYLSEREDFLHIVLEADRETALLRISRDTEEIRDRKFSINHLDRNIEFLAANYDEALRINTNGKSVDCVADEIIRRCFKEE